MHHHDGFGARRDLRLDPGDIHVPGTGVAVDEDGAGAVSDDLSDARNDGECGHDHFIARPDAQRLDCGIERSGSIADRNAPFAVHPGGKCRLELLYKRPFGGDPPSVDALRKIFLLIAVEQWFIDRYEFIVPHRSRVYPTSGMR